MNVVRKVVLVCGAMVSALLALAAWADGENDGIVEYRSTQSGWSVPSADQNVDIGDLDGFVSTTSGQSSLGRVSTNSVGDLADWDGLTICDFDPETGVPIAVELQVLKDTTVIRVGNGDLITAELDTSYSNTLCFYFLTETNTAEVHQIVTGGTGKYAGATGSLTLSVSGQQLDGQTALQSTTTGTIYRQP